MIQPVLSADIASLVFASVTDLVPKPMQNMLDFQNLDPVTVIVIIIVLFILVAVFSGSSSDGESESTPSTDAEPSLPPRQPPQYLDRPYEPFRRNIPEFVKSSRQSISPLVDIEAENRRSEAIEVVVKMLGDLQGRHRLDALGKLSARLPMGISGRNAARLLGNLSGRQRRDAIELLAPKITKKLSPAEVDLVFDKLSDSDRNAVINALS